MQLFKGIEDNQFWLTIWTFVITGIIIVVTLVSLYSIDQTRTIAQLVADGNDPLEVACLFSRTATLEPTCFILMQARVKQYDLPE